MNKLKEAPTALIVRLPSWSACRDSSRHLTMGTEPFRQKTRYHHLAKSTQYEPFKP